MEDGSPSGDFASLDFILDSPLVSNELMHTPLSKQTLRQTHSSRFPLGSTAECIFDVGNDFLFQEENRVPSPDVVASKQLLPNTRPLQGTPLKIVPPSKRFFDFGQALPNKPF